jgi:predicted metal-dependent hydrolase
MFGLFRRKRAPVAPPPKDQLPLALDGSSNRPAEQAPPQRTALLCQQAVRWQLVRSRRRTIGFQIDHRGLRVSAPRWVPLAEIEQALQEKGEWVVRKLAEWQAHERRRQELMPRWEHGAPLKILGASLNIELDPQCAGVEVDGSRLIVGLPKQADSTEIRKHIEVWLQDRARELFAERIAVFAQKLGRSPSCLKLSSARTRWGSCAPDGSIRLNWRLMHYSRDIIDYVIAHEMAHLVEMNHGPKFWATVGSLLPDYEHIRSSLRHHYDDMPAG